MSQAIVKYLQAQYSEYDGEQQRFIQGMWGIFGHGNVSGMSQALVECGQDLPYHQPTNEQSMVHAATGFARTMRRKATMACTTSIGPEPQRLRYAEFRYCYSPLTIMLLATVARSFRTLII